MYHLITVNRRLRDCIGDLRWDQSWRLLNRNVQYQINSTFSGDLIDVKVVLLVIFFLKYDDNKDSDQFSKNERQRSEETPASVKVCLQDLKS